MERLLVEESDVLTCPHRGSSGQQVAASLRATKDGTAVWPPPQGPTWTPRKTFHSLKRRHSEEEDPNEAI